MSARKRLCFLYRSSFKGSCQYCACTRLITTKTQHPVRATHQSNRTNRPLLWTAHEIKAGRHTSNLLFLHQVGVRSIVQSFTDHVADVGALSGTPGQPVHSWGGKKHKHKERGSTNKSLRQESFKYPHRNYDILNTYNSVRLSKFHLLRKIIITLNSNLTLLSKRGNICGQQCNHSVMTDTKTQSGIMLTVTLCDS